MANRTAPTGVPDSELRAMPLVPAGAFVLVWCTGYIAGPIGVEAVEPLSLVWIRFAIAAACVAGIAWWRSGPPRVPRGAVVRLAVTGVLINGVCFSGMYLAFEQGMDGTLGALFHSLSPVLTALLAALVLRERLGAVQVLGFVVGVTGVLLVLGPEIEDAGGLLALVFAAAGTLALSLGTMGQRWAVADPGTGRSLSIDPWWSAAIQFGAAVPVSLLLAVPLEGLDPIIEPGQAVVAIAWLAIANSVVGLLLLSFVVRAAGAGASASLFFLMPPVTAVQAYLVLGDTLNAREVAGLLITVIGVGAATAIGTSRAP